MMAGYNGDADMTGMSGLNSQKTGMTGMASEIGYNTYQGYEKELVTEHSSLQDRMKI